MNSLEKYQSDKSRFNFRLTLTMNSASSNDCGNFHLFFLKIKLKMSHINQKRN